jgi:hypothetical protein
LSNRFDEVLRQEMERWVAIYFVDALELIILAV